MFDFFHKLEAKAGEETSAGGSASPESPETVAKREKDLESLGQKDKWKNPHHVIRIESLREGDIRVRYRTESTRKDRTGDHIFEGIDELKDFLRNEGFNLESRRSGAIGSPNQEDIDRVLVEISKKNPVQKETVQDVEPIEIPTSSSVEEPAAVAEPIQPPVTETVATELVESPQSVPVAPAEETAEAVAEPEKKKNNETIPSPFGVSTSQREETKVKVRSADVVQLDDFRKKSVPNEKGPGNAPLQSEGSEKQLDREIEEMIGRAETLIGKNQEKLHEMTSLQEDDRNRLLDLLKQMNDQAQESKILAKMGSPLDKKKVSERLKALVEDLDVFQLQKKKETPSQENSLGEYFSQEPNGDRKKTTLIKYVQGIQKDFKHGLYGEGVSKKARDEVWLSDLVPRIKETVMKFLQEKTGIPQDRHEGLIQALLSESLEKK